MSTTRRRSPVPNARDIELTTLGHPQDTPASLIFPSVIPSDPPFIDQVISYTSSTDSAATNPETTMPPQAHRSALEWSFHEMQMIPMGYKILSTVLAVAFTCLLWIYFMKLPHHALESDTDWNPEKARHTLWVGIMTALILVLVVGTFIICLYCAREGARLGEEDVRRERLAGRQPRPPTGAERRDMRRQERHQRGQEQVIDNLTRAGII